MYLIFRWTKSWIEPQSPTFFLSSHIMKRLLIILLAAVIFTAASDKTPQQLYIEKYAVTAVREMYRSGVPASITLAQGLLESRYGESRLASEGNNHFGIKCHRDWTGKTIYADDDEKNECFRAYGSADQSFRDHSDFLRYKDRYKFLFEYDITDYKSWALGLRQAGYATDPTYGQKLIGIIENYKLYEYDTMKNSEEVEEYVEEQSKMDSKTEAKVDDGKDSQKTEPKSETRERTKTRRDSDKVASAKLKDKESAKDRRARERAEKEAQKKKSTSRTKTRAKSSQSETEFQELPSSPLSIEESVQMDKSGLEQFQFNLSRPTYMRNGVAFVYAIEGETFESIARDYHLFLKEILGFNDVKSVRPLNAGEMVFIQSKKKQAPKGLEKYIVSEDGEKLWDICQRFAVKQQAIEKLNGFANGRELYEGDTILLR